MVDKQSLSQAARTKASESLDERAVARGFIFCAQPLDFPGYIWYSADIIRVTQKVRPKGHPNNQRFEMKTRMLLVSLLVMLSAIWPIGASAQTGDTLKQIIGAAASAADAKREKDKLSRASRAYNADQPGVGLARQTIEVRPPRDQWDGWDSRQRRWVRSSLSAPLTTIGARPVWNGGEIEEESLERDSLESNRWVNQKSLPDKGTIEVAAFTLEFEFLELEKAQDVEVFWGRWWNQNGLRLSRETAYCGLTATVRDRHSGEVLAVYKTLGSASSADNVSAQLGGFFSNSLGFSSNGNSEDDRRFRAMENALREMGTVIKQKCR